MNKKIIRDMAQVDGVDGVFIDECSNFPNENGKEYLKELTDLAHSYGLLTWGNVGVNNFDSWFFTDGGFDRLILTRTGMGRNSAKSSVTGVTGLARQDSKPPIRHRTLLT